jgi:hypothetical protein
MQSAGKDKTVGETMTEKQYRAGLKGEDVASFASERLEFNEYDGMYYKGSDWDNTYLVLDQKLNVGAFGFLSQQDEFKSMDVDAISYLMQMYSISHELSHGLQDYLELFKKKVDPKTKLYKKNEKIDQVIPWEERSQEKDAEFDAQQLILNFLESVPMPIKFK